MNEINDESLALDVQNGRYPALAILVERYHAPLLGFLYRMTNGHTPLAEDLLQETFMRMMQKIRESGNRRPS